MPDSVDLDPPALATEPPYTRISPGLVLLLGALTAFAPLSVDMYLPSMPGIGLQLGSSASDAQITLATFFAGLAIGPFLYGPASDRWGRRPPLLVGIAVYILASTACAFAPTIPFLAGARFVQALGGGAGAVIARAVVRDRFRAHDSARVLSLLMLIMGLGPVLAPFLGGAVLTVFSWRGIFGVLALFGSTMGVATWFGLRETRTPETAAQARDEHPARSYLALLRKPPMVGLMVSGSFSSAPLFAYLSAAPAVVMGYYGVSRGHFIWVFGANAASMIPASQLNAQLLRRSLSPEQILVWARPFSLIFAVVMAVDATTGFGGLWGVLAPLFCLLGVSGFILPNVMAKGLSVDPRRIGSASALLGGAQYCVGALVSGLIAAARDSSPRPLAYGVLASVIISTVALYAVGLSKPAKKA